MGFLQSQGKYFPLFDAIVNFDLLGAPAWALRSGLSFVDLVITKITGNIHVKDDRISRYTVCGFHNLVSGQKLSATARLYALYGINVYGSQSFCTLLGAKSA